MFFICQVDLKYQIYQDKSSLEEKCMVYKIIVLI